ncbi:MAG: amylo-alpha-1,6-glucosidase [Desulfobacterales bacterium]
MNVSDRLKQEPAPGAHLLRFRGDTCTFALSAREEPKGRAWLRTNIGQGRTIRSEILREVLHDESPLSRDWFDIPMQEAGHGFFTVTLPLCEVGHFEAKAYFLAEGKTDPLWPPGPNTIINTEPADTCCANIIYNAFVRQFGPNKSGKGRPSEPQSACISMLDQTGYTVIPKSGTFRDLIQELDFILGELGCRWLQLLPVHPTPTTYARMGRFGSPYAALSFTEVDPALAEFDPKATPLEQFIELVDAVHARHGKLIMDIAINHTGWAASLHETHPQWLSRDEKGHIRMPGAWGVTWEDLTELDYSHTDLWQYMADVFLTWCRRGVDGFRCDAGYKIPARAWRFIAAAVREQYPDTVFFLEGLGGKISVTRELLDRANLNWAYSELFQNYDRGQISYYLPGAFDIGQSEGVMIHFAETHDNNRLAARSHAYAKMRTALCALASQNGGFGFANGVEWFAAEKINVHDACSLNWGAEQNQIAHIRHLNRLLRHHPAFHDQAELRLIQQGEGNGIVLLRHHRPSGAKLLVLVNLDDASPARLSWHSHDMNARNFRELLGSNPVSAEKAGDMRICHLQPAQVLCLEPADVPSPNPEDFQNPQGFNGFPVPRRITAQCLRAKALEIFCQCKGTGHMADFDPDAAGQQLAENPSEYCRSLNSSGRESRVILWNWPEDLRREVMIPPDHFLLLQSPFPFRASVMDRDTAIGHEQSLPDRHGKHFALFSPFPVPQSHLSRILRISMYEPGKCEHGEGHVLLLSRPEHARVQQVFHRSEILRKDLLFMGTNARGGMLRAGVSWGALQSRYDGLLAANISPLYPEDRRIMFTRCRAWVVFQGFSYEIGSNCLATFRTDESSRAFWKYRIPTGQGEDIDLHIAMEMMGGKNAMRICFFRDITKGKSGQLPDEKAVRLILRPDIEDRSFHDVTKAFMGPEHEWHKAVTARSGGFVFAPSAGRKLQVDISPGSFFYEPEWKYMIHRPLEADRGLDPDSDLFSPGYFSAFLRGGQECELHAQVMGADAEPVTFGNPLVPISQNCAEKSCDMVSALSRAVDHFVVARENLQTVIAGYPWFLDWGRDTLIFVRGLIAAGRTEESRSILKQFARFEENGTIPNMIRGNDAGNRDTSDAPLWFFTACADLIHAEGTDSFLNEKCGNRKIREILSDMANSLLRGTSNGIRTDPDSGLLFSPSHFTWMDTNHPAGTPREGYPVEIQALWQSALSFLARIAPEAEKSRWQKAAEQVRKSLTELFFLKDKGYLSDCLHARPGQSALQAKPDDALRPNQLFALTLGAVDDPDLCRNVLDACSALLIPGAIRSLADRPVEYPLAIRHHGRLLNNPHHPYQGIYAGDEDTRRKPAYHNGTAWTWVFPSFCEAWAQVYGEEGRKTALTWLGSCTRLTNTGCVGHLPEITDGNFPHTPKGCDAQAWSASEVLRVWLKVSAPDEKN